MNFIDRNEKEDNVTHTTIDISWITSKHIIDFILLKHPESTQTRYHPLFQYLFLIRPFLQDKDAIFTMIINSQSLRYYQRHQYSLRNLIILSRVPDFQRYYVISNTRYLNIISLSIDVYCAIFQELLPSLTSLKQLTINHRLMHTKYSLHNILTNLPLSVQTLGLRFCDFQESDVIQLSNMKQITSLDLTSYRAELYTTKQDLLTNMIPQLKSLDLSDDCATYKVVNNSYLVSYLNSPECQLEYLGIPYCWESSARNMISNSSLISLCIQNQYIFEDIVPFCRQLLKVCKSLKNLIIEIDPEDLEENDDENEALFYNLLLQYETITNVEVNALPLNEYRLRDSNSNKECQIQEFIKKISDLMSTRIKK